MDADMDRDKKDEGEPPESSAEAPRRLGDGYGQKSASVPLHTAATGGLGIRCTGMEEISRQIVNMKFGRAEAKRDQ
jgi:hypothetical protein